MNKFLRTLAVMLLAIMGYVAANATSYTVYVDNSDAKWTKVNAWIWGSKNYSGGTWPGKAMTQSTVEYNGAKLYSYTFDSDETDGTSGTLKCIFNNGTYQTGDYPLTNGYVYKYTSNKAAPTVVGKVVNGAVTSVTVTTYTYKIYYDNSSTAWSSVYAYLYGASEYAGAWPGKACTQTSIAVNGANLWMYEVKDVANAASDWHVIFNNNGGGGQTGNLDMVDGNVYSGTNGTVIGTVKDGVYTAAGNTGGDTGGNTGDSTDPVFYVVGAQTNWSFADVYKMTKTGTNDAGQVVYTLTASKFDGEFKVATSDWKMNFGGGQEDGDYDATNKVVVFSQNDSTKDGWYNGLNFKVSGSNLTFYLYYVSGTGVDGSTTQSFLRVTNGSTMVNEINVDGTASPAVYYNLNGVRVDNPRGGMFIRVCDGKASKVVLK